MREGIIKNMQRLNKNEEHERTADEASEVAKLDLEAQFGEMSDDAFGDAGMQVGSLWKMPQLKKFLASKMLTLSLARAMIKPEDNSGMR